MSDRRVRKHPILPVPTTEDLVPFHWNGEPLAARPGEVISSALFAAGIHTFGHHHRDGAPQGIFCANGQCAQCTVLADGVAAKSCMEPVREGMDVRSCEGLPPLPLLEGEPHIAETRHLSPRVLIIGGGPAGLSAAIELGRLGVEVLLIDDKGELGGKLVLQTHKFFGSVKDTQAGTRGVDIARNLAEAVLELESVEVWTQATAVGVYSDQKVGVVRDGAYTLIEPEALLIASGAREKQIPFPGHTLPGVYGAGAFQTLLNRDLVRPCERLFVLGAGNVGIIAAYHAMQAGIEVVGIAEALPEVGGYLVHADKLKRLGVPIYTRHSVVAAHGDKHIDSVTVAEVDERFQVIEGSERVYEVDTLLVAVGLAPLDEFLHQARAFGMKAWAAGDAAEIAEASAATFSGRIVAMALALDLGLDLPEVPDEWGEKLEVLKAKPGATEELFAATPEQGVFPILRCMQEIPCNPCATVCHKHAIEMQGHEIQGRPRYTGDACSGCALCVSICPGLAVTMVDTRKDPDNPVVTVPYEQSREGMEKGAMVTGLDREGAVIGRFEVVQVRDKKFQDRTLLVKVRAPMDAALQIAGIRTGEVEHTPIDGTKSFSPSDDVVICRCERITAGEIRQAIRDGVRDVNEMKALLRVCMGACSGKNCPAHLLRLFREEGVDLHEVVEPTTRPLFVEVPFGVFAGGSEEK